jgi:hypothetical protein
MTDKRVIVVENTNGYPWPWTAELQMLDGDEWIVIDRADGDTPDEARSEMASQRGQDHA